MTEAIEVDPPGAATRETSSGMEADSELETARLGFRDALIREGHLIPTGIAGLYGRGRDFECIVSGINSAASRAANTAYTEKVVQQVRFPPVFPRKSFERTDYIASFPQLTGAVSTFVGDDRAHRELLADREAGRGWDSHLASADTMLVSAACHPLYSTLAGELPRGGLLYDVYGYCFRHEPAVDPARMQAFRMREFVYVGEASSAEAHRDEWVPRALEVLAGLGLDAHAVPANDPFFGRAGRMLAANQVEENLKTEMVVRLYGDLDDGTAVMSCNCHRDHFGENFAINTSDGAVAHSACVGFGLERIALALMSTYGLRISHWPASVIRELGF